MPSEINVIAIDGPAASGKTVVGRKLACYLGFAYLDTGIMYRAVTWLALHQGVSVDDTSSLVDIARANPIKLVPDYDTKVIIAGLSLGAELREPSVDSNVSKVARVSAVRKELVAQQKEVAKTRKIVMIGRDIGTVVLPNADLKIYLNASAEIRAQRRWREITRRGENQDLDSVLEETLTRDQTDKGRKDSPLRLAKDAWELNTDDLDVHQVVNQIIDRVRTL